MRWRIATLLTAGLLLLAGGLGYAEGPLGVQEAPLDPDGEAYELNRTGSGALLLSDYGADEIRRIDAVSGAYIAYTVPSPTDGRQDSSGRIWFTNAGDTFGYVNPVAGTVTTWSLGNGSGVSLSGTAFDDAGRVWLTEWFGSTSKLRRFDPTTRELCSWALPGGANSYYIIYNAGGAWTANWGNDSVYRFDPAAGEGRRWYIGEGSFPQGIAVDANGDLWLADAARNTLLRLSPGTDQLATFALPLGSSPQMLTVINGKVWYTESGSGTVGVLVDPAAASPSIATAESNEFTLAGSCAVLAEGTMTQVSSVSGTLAWSDNEWQEVKSSGGWTVYQLPSEASPYGIVGYSGQPWVVDQGRQMLARAGGASSLKVFLPLLQR